MKMLILTLLFLGVKGSYAVCPDGKTYKVSLTFDDGPVPSMTPRVLDALEKNNAKATFFILGSHLSGGKSNPANREKYKILDRMKKGGHIIGSHTYHHYNHPTKTEEEIIENINRPNELLKGYLSPVLRLPYGGGAFKSANPVSQKKNDFVMSSIKKSGFKHVLWDIDTNDWDVKKQPHLESNMLKDICRKKGGVILFHDIQENTVRNIDKWIKAIKAEGHEIVGLEHFVPEASGQHIENCELPGSSSKTIDELELFIQGTTTKINEDVLKKNRDNRKKEEALDRLIQEKSKSSSDNLGDFIKGL